MKDPADKNKWLVDEPAAAVVRRIFQMAMEGIGPFQIARTLSQEKVEKPSYHTAKSKMAGAKPAMYDMSTPYAWSTSTVCKILSKSEYAGHTVNFRTSKKSFKDKISYNPKEEWKIFPNTHEAIIDQETFDTVQRLRARPHGQRRRTQPADRPCVLRGLRRQDVQQPPVEGNLRDGKTWQGLPSKPPITTTVPHTIWHLRATSKNAPATTSAPPSSATLCWNTSGYQPVCFGE